MPRCAAPPCVPSMCCAQCDTPLPAHPIRPSNPALLQRPVGSCASCVLPRAPTAGSTAPTAGSTPPAELLCCATQTGALCELQPRTGCPTRAPTRAPRELHACAEAPRPAAGWRKQSSTPACVALLGAHCGASCGALPGAPCRGAAVAGRRAARVEHPRRGGASGGGASGGGAAAARRRRDAFSLEGEDESA